jgi:hypothetical protein
MLSVSSFAWVGDNEVFCLLYNPEQDLALKAGLDFSAPSGKITDMAKLKEFKRFANGKKVGTMAKLQSLKGLCECRFVMLQYSLDLPHRPSCLFFAKACKISAKEQQRVSPKLGKG